MYFLTLNTQESIDFALRSECAVVLLLEAEIGIYLVAVWSIDKSVDLSLDPPCGEAGTVCQDRLLTEWSHG